MTRNFLPGLIVVILLLGCVGALAMPANDRTVMRYSGLNEFAHRGNYVVDNIAGRSVASPAHGLTPAAVDAQESGAARYATQNALLTLVFFAAVGVWLFGFAVVGKFMRRPIRPTGREAMGRDAWREALSEMLEADLNNLDSMTHGFSGR